ncbi:hypothetical protein C8R45DRAFT_1094946 [Mycena sanguinolenta]|nr:hypothetical protein C8R45DRAFT_1094946 [Mycena sanguinolenta]
MNNASLAIDMLVIAVGETRLVEYVRQTFPPEIENLESYSVENAAEWLDVDKFTRWLTGESVPQSFDATSSRAVRRSGESQRSDASGRRRNSGGSEDRA